MTTAHFTDHMDPNADNAAERMLRFLRAHALIIVAAMLIAAGAAVAISMSQPKRYAATATLLFSDPTQNVINPQGNTTLDPQRASDTNQQLLSLGVIAADASRALHGKFSPNQVSADVNVGSIGQSNLLQI